MQASGRKGSWGGDPSVLGSIVGRHLTSPSALVYGDNLKTAKVEPERALKFTAMWRELQQTCPNLSFKKKDLLAGFFILYNGIQYIILRVSKTTTLFQASPSNHYVWLLIRPGSNHY